MRVSTLHALISIYNKTDNDKIYHDVAGLILDNISSIPELTINEVADLCFTSPSTISRLIRLLGCSGFAEFKHDIADAINGYRFYNRCMPYELSHSALFPSSYISFLKSSLDYIESTYEPDIMDGFVDTLHKSKQVFFFADEVSYEPKTQLQFDLVISGKKTYFMQDDKAQAKLIDRIEEGDTLFVLVTAMVRSSYLYDLIKKAKKANAKVLALITENAPNVTGKVDYYFKCRHTNTAADHITFNTYVSLITMAYRNKYLE